MVYFLSFLPNNLTNIQTENIRGGLQFSDYILLLPIFILISLFFHYIIGWKNLNLGFQLILTFVFLEALQQDNVFNLPNFLFLLLFTVLTFILLGLTAVLFKNLTMHYKPKIGLIISSVTLLSFISIVIINLFIPLTSISLSPFVMIAILISLENYIKILIRKGFMKTINLILSTATVIGINLILAMNQTFRMLLNKYPISILAVLLIFIIGYWKAFRLSEYFRFWELLNKEHPDDQENN